MYAEKLKENDFIGIFSPSSPATFFAEKRYERSKKFLESRGFRIKEGILTGKSDFYRSGNIQERAEELNLLIKDKSVKCIMSAIGGYNSNSILPFIDYKEISENPKIFTGYSDVTAILLGIYAKTGLITFYGPAAVASFGEFEPLVSETWKYFSDIAVEGKYPLEIENPKFWTEEYIEWNEQDRGKILRENKLYSFGTGKYRGRLIGGNLNTIMGIWGSEYMPEIKEGDILFIEDTMKNAAIIERSFAFLKINGVFDKLQAIILGKHEKFDDMNTGRRPFDILREFTNLPLLAEFDCCHTHPMITLPIGGNVEVDIDRKKVTVLDKYII